MGHTVVRSGLLLLAAACLPLPSAAGAHDLTFEERVAAQEAIERVAYAHQIGAQRPFAEAVPRAVIERKVQSFLEQSDALERFWHTTIDEDALRDEWQRIERQSPFPDRLREIYAALGNDARLIGECFVRPVLTQRLTRSFFEGDERIHGAARRRAEALRADLHAGAAEATRADVRERSVEYVVQGNEDVPSTEGTLELSREEYGAMRAGLGLKRGEVSPVEDGLSGYTVRVLSGEDAERTRIVEYTVPKRSWQEWWSSEARVLALEAQPVATIWRSAGDAALEQVLQPRGAGTCPVDDTWDNGPFEDIPDYVSRHAAVWTGSEMLVWGGVGQTLAAYPTGWRYDPGTDAWRRITKVGAPIPRGELTAVWTGTQMVVWGGDRTNTGGRYDPATDTWQPTSLLNAPSARTRHSAVWTGTRMIVWGGTQLFPTVPLGDGASYDPVTDTWTAISSVGAPSPRESHTAVWTGTEMIVWGGRGATALGTGARYNPANDTWTALPTAGAPAARAYHTAVWTGTEMIVFGGQDQFNLTLQTGGRWSAAAGWSATTLTGAPGTRWYHTAVWTGDRMLVWGGAWNDGYFYDPAMNQWSPSISTTNAPSTRNRQTGVWTGDRLIVFGGEVNTTTPTFTGGRYHRASNTWTPTSTGGAAADVAQLPLGGTPVWSGTELLFLSYRGPGYGYDPLTNTLRVIPASGRPAGSTGLAQLPSPVWTGTEAILWGESEGATGFPPGRGLRYNPIGDVWTEMSTVDAPWARTGHSMVWTGSLLIVWAGSGGTNPLADGQKYNLATDTWLADIPTENAPLNRSGHCAFWDGDEMIVYGGSGLQGSLSGGRFNEATNTWAPMAPGTVPGDANTCLWTGTEFFVGAASAYYNPASDTWTSTSNPTIPLGSPATSARVWTGTRFVRWGGDTGGGIRTNNGARYDIATNTWTPMSLVKAPEPRTPKWFAWVEPFMIVSAGGYSSGFDRRDGGRYIVNVDTDGDGTGELCDNCPGLSNAGQADADTDGFGDACDTCTDTDGDAFGDPGYSASTCALDNCPDDANPTQLDFDVDGAGDVCDSCTDTDHDGAGNGGFPANTCATDNCSVVFNSVQRDSDGDGFGDLCDVCPSLANLLQQDLDGDGAGDACDCRPSDPSDRAPGVVSGLTVSQPVPGTISLSWSPAIGADTYSITRGTLGSIGTGQYGSCLIEGVTATTYADATAPAAGQGFGYLIQGDDDSCGLGSLGYDSTETERVNGTVGACQGN